MPTGRFCWYDLMTTDPEAWRGFYTEVDYLMWTTPRGPLGGVMQLPREAQDADYQIYGQPGNPMPLGGMFNLTEEMEASPAWVYYITVDSLEATLEKVRAHGGRVTVEPMEVPGGDRIAQCTDPQRAFFALHEPATQPQA